MSEDLHREGRAAEVCRIVMGVVLFGVGVAFVITVFIWKVLRLGSH